MVLDMDNPEVSPTDVRSAAGEITETCVKARVITLDYRTFLATNL